MFPGYILVCFELMATLRQVASAHAVTRVVRFGDSYPVVEKEFVNRLRVELDGDEMVTVEKRMRTGDEVEVVEGPMEGMSAIVTRLLPAKERVRILLEILGQAREVEVPEGSLLSTKKGSDLAVS